MALSVKLYRVVGKGKDRRYIPIDLGRRGRRPKEDFTGPFYFRYGVNTNPLAWISKRRSKPCSAGRLRLTLWAAA